MPQTCEYLRLHSEGNEADEIKVANQLPFELSLDDPGVPRSSQGPKERKPEADGEARAVRWDGRRTQRAVSDLEDGGRAQEPRDVGVSGSWET